MFMMEQKGRLQEWLHKTGYILFSAVLCEKVRSALASGRQ